jgi:hypothetical protein
MQKITLELDYTALELLSRMTFSELGNLEDKYAKDLERFGKPEEAEHASEIAEEAGNDLAMTIRAALDQVENKLGYS